MSRTSSLLLASLFVSATALAAPASITAVKGDVKIGKEGAWKAATAGAAVPEAEFLMVTSDSTVTVKLGDGTSHDFSGKSLIPGRRLASVKAAGPLLKFSRQLQKAAESVVGVDTVGTVPGAGKACTPEQIKLGTCIKGSAEDKDPRKIGGMIFEGDGGGNSSEAKFAELYLDDGDRFGATTRSEAILKDKNASDFEKRRASLVLANVKSDLGEFTQALSLLEKVIAKPTATEKDAGMEVAARSRKVAGLVLRGEIYNLLGDTKKAKADFEAAASEFPADKLNEFPVAGHRAHLHLAMMSIDESDVENARKWVEKIAVPAAKPDEAKATTHARELRTAGDEMLKNAGTM